MFIYQNEQRYEPGKHDCSLLRMRGEGQYCHKTSDCPEGLACDTTRNGAHSNSCKRSHSKFCHKDSDCANGLKCNQQDNLCSCDHHEYFDELIGDCVSEKQFREPCIENRECAHGLICDIRVQVRVNRNSSCLSLHCFDNQIKFYSLKSQLL